MKRNSTSTASRSLRAGSAAGWMLMIGMMVVLALGAATVGLIIWLIIRNVH